MSEALDSIVHHLQGVSFDVFAIPLEHCESFIFENDTVLGFGLLYETPAQIIESWAVDADNLIASRHFQLRASANKAWNTYVLFLAKERAKSGEIVALSLIEEDLVGYRKIARAGCIDATELQRALLPLLPIQAAPILDPVDSQIEIRQRATDVSPRLLKAFLSEADDQVVLQMLEQES